MKPGPSGTSVSWSCDCKGHRVCVCGVCVCVFACERASVSTRMFQLLANKLHVERTCSDSWTQRVDTVLSVHRRQIDHDSSACNSFAKS